MARRTAPRPDPGSDPSPEQPQGFESSLDEVEGLIERIESGELGLEEAIAAYERGVALIGRCRSVLDQAEQRVDELDRSLEAGSDRDGGGDEPIADGPGG